MDAEKRSKNILYLFRMIKDVKYASEPKGMTVATKKDKANNDK